MTSDGEKEVRDRLRRIETRVTRFLEAQGFEANVQRPCFHNGIVTLPSARISVKDALDCIPNDWIGSVNLMLNGQVLGEMRLPIAD